MPPREGPMIAYGCSMPSACAASYPPRAMSSTARSGNVSRYADPVCGSTDAGPVEPKQLPIEFTHRTKKRLVSIASPGPIIRSHQPSLGSAAEDAACAGGERPVKSTTALSLAALSSPQHSKATRASRSEPPLHNGNGLGSMAKWRASPPRSPACAEGERLPLPSGLGVATVRNSFEQRSRQIALARVGQHGED